MEPSARTAASSVAGFPVAASAAEDSAMVLVQLVSAVRKTNCFLYCDDILVLVAALPGICSELFELHLDNSNVAAQSGSDDYRYGWFARLLLYFQSAGRPRPV